MGNEVEKKLVIWWAPKKEDDNAFVMAAHSVELGIQALEILSVYDKFLKENDESKDFGSGALAFMDKEGQLSPWKHIDFLNGGKEYTDPIEYLTAKYEKTTIIA